MRQGPRPPWRAWLSLRPIGPGGCYLERLLVQVDLVAALHLLGLAEQDEVFKEEHVPQILLPPAANDKLVSAFQLPLLLQIHLQRNSQGAGLGSFIRARSRSHTHCCLRPAMWVSPDPAVGLVQLSVVKAAPAAPNPRFPKGHGRAEKWLVRGGAGSTPAGCRVPWPGMGNTPVAEQGVEGGPSHQLEKAGPSRAPTPMESGLDLSAFPQRAGVQHPHPPVFNAAQVSRLPVTQSQPALHVLCNCSQHLPAIVTPGAPGASGLAAP